MRRLTGTPLRRPSRRKGSQVTIYVSAKAKAEAERRAATKSVATGTLLRMILVGQEKPLKP